MEGTRKKTVTVPVQRWGGGGQSPSCPDESTGKLSPLELLKWKKEIREDSCHPGEKPLTLQVGSGGEVTLRLGPSRNVQTSQPVTLETLVVAAMKGTGG